MKRILPSAKIMLVLIFTALLLQQVRAQTLLTENFDYPAGTFLNAVGWNAHSGTAEPVSVVVPGLTFTGYPLSNIGGAAHLDNTGEDVNKTFTAQTTGSIYVAFMVKFGQLHEGYFLHLGQTVTGSTHFGRVWSIPMPEIGKHKFGLTKTNEETTVSSTVFDKSKTHLVVLKYKIVDGTTNDEVSLFVIDGTIPANEPATATIPAFTTTAADYSPGSIALRQFAWLQDITVDGIRIANSWAEAVSAPTAAEVEFIPANRISLYPVPSGKEIFISNVKDVTAIEVFDIYGRMQMMEICDGAVSKRMDISRLTSGIYIMRFIKPGVPEIMKFLKE